MPPAQDMQRCGVIVSYEGPTERGGRLHGSAVRAELQNGATYTGDYHRGFMHGRGEYRWADGIKYSGQFELGELTGQGKMEWPSGDVYVGQICRGYRHGSGTHTKVVHLACATCRVASMPGREGAVQHGGTPLHMLRVASTLRPLQANVRTL